MTRYFAGMITIEAVKTAYRELAKRWHPDKPGGDLATMQAVNAQYHEALKNLDGNVSQGTDGREHTYRYDEAVEQEVMDKLAEILAIKGTFEVVLIGTWIWITGDTRPIKGDLGKDGAKCKWHSKRMCWYWRPSGSRHYGKPNPGGLDSLAAKYGAKSFCGTETDSKMATA